MAIRQEKPRPESEIVIMRVPASGKDSSYRRRESRLDIGGAALSYQMDGAPCKWYQEIEHPEGRIGRPWPRRFFAFFQRGLFVSDKKRPGPNPEPERSLLGDKKPPIPGGCHKTGCKDKIY